MVGKQRYEGLKLLLKYSDCESFLEMYYWKASSGTVQIFNSTGTELLLPQNYYIPFDKIVLICVMLCHVLDVHHIFFSSLLFKLCALKNKISVRCYCYSTLCLRGFPVTGNTIKTSPATFCSGSFGPHPQSSRGLQGLSWKALKAPPGSRDSTFPQQSRPALLTQVIRYFSERLSVLNPD